MTGRAEARRIQVGVDGSRASLRALSWAIGEARLSGEAAVTAVTVLPEPGASAGFLRHLVGAALEVEEAVRRTAAGFPVVHVVRYGRTAAALVAESAGADLLVVGTRGRGGVPALRMGSVSRSCLHRAPCPVVVVPEEGRADHRGAPVAVGVDASAPSRTALALAAAEARLRGTELIVVHAVYWDPLGVELLTPDEAELQEWGRRLLDGMLAEADLDVPVRPVVLAGHPAEVLVRCAEEAELLVVGSQGRGAVSGLALGSVSDHCARHAPCPVLVVRERTRR